MGTLRRRRDMTKTLTQVSTRFIRFLLFPAAVAVLGHDGAHAQQNTITGYNQVVGQWDASHAARTNVNRQGVGSPNGRDQCNRVGESYYQTDAAAGQNVWYCTALPTTWTNGNAGAGTVTSVGCNGLFATNWLTCSFGGSPTTTPILQLTPTSGLTANQFLATPNGSTGAVGLRAIVGADIPTLNQKTTGSAVSLSGTQTPNFIYASPNGSAGLGSWRALVAPDLPPSNGYGMVQLT